MNEKENREHLKKMVEIMQRGLPTHVSPNAIVSQEQITREMKHELHAIIWDVENGREYTP